MRTDSTQSVFLFPGDLGSIDDYFDPTAPSAQITSKGDPLYTGGLYLRAALQEMNRILRLCEELEENHRDLLRETKAQYDNLDRWKKELQLLQKRRSIFKLLELRAIRRAKREFRESAKQLWNSTQTTSDRLRRALLSVPSVDVSLVERESLGEGVRIEGLIAELPPPGEMSAPATQEALAAAQKVVSILASRGNPFVDPTPADSHDAQSSTGRPSLNSEASSSTRSSFLTSPGSPGSLTSIGYLNLNVSYNVVTNTDSTTPGFTINTGSESSGSTIEHHSSVTSPPS